MAIQLRSSTKPQSSSLSLLPSSPSSTTQSKSSSASKPPRRSARLSSTTPSEPPPEPSHRRKRVRLTGPSSPPQPTARALRLEKRNKEREEHPTPSQKRKATSTDELVVRKKPRSPCRISATNSTSESVNLDLDLPDIGPTPISPHSPTSEPVPVWVSPIQNGTFPNPAELLEQPDNTTANFYPPDNHAPVQQDPQIPQQWYLPPQPQNFERRPPRPPRPRQEGLHEQMIKAKMCELKRLFSDTRIRQEVDKEAKAYYDAHGLQSWDLSVDPSESPQLLTWKNESEIFPPTDLSTDTPRYSDVDDDTDDDDDDDDDEIDESFGGEVMDLDAPLQCPTVSQGPAVSSEWFDSPQSGLTTSFSLPPAQEADTQSMMLPQFTASYYTSFPQYAAPPPMISIPVDTPLPRLSSIKVMGLRNLFDIGPRIEDEEEELHPSFTDLSLLSSPGGLSPDQLRARKRRRDGMGRGTPPDPVRRAMWASAGAENLWTLDSTADIEMSLAMNRFVPHTDWNALWATTEMDGVDKQFTAFQQVCAVLSGVATNYST